MTHIERCGIWDLADYVRGMMDLGTPLTVDSLKDAVQRVGGECVAKDLDELQDDFDAYIVTENENDSVCDKKFQIVYASWKASTRILFSIAHELGHLFLHLLDDHGNVLSQAKLHRNLQSSKMELEANEFAAALLMPTEKFIDICSENTSHDEKTGRRIVNVIEVARYFNVSTQAATVRGKILQLW